MHLTELQNSTFKPRHRFQISNHAHRAGDLGLEMYIIRKGCVGVIGNNNQLMSVLGPGEYFGEIALFTQVGVVSKRVACCGVVWGGEGAAAVTMSAGAHARTHRKHSLDFAGQARRQLCGAVQLRLVHALAHKQSHTVTQPMRAKCAAKCIVLPNFDHNTHTHAHTLSAGQALRQVRRAVEL